MRGLRNFERRLQKIENQIAAEDKAAAAAGQKEEVASLEAVLNRSEPCAFCLKIMQREKSR